MQNLDADSVWHEPGFLTDMLKSMYITAGFALAWLLSRAFPNQGSTWNMGVAPADQIMATTPYDGQRPACGYFLLSSSGRAAENFQLCMYSIHAYYIQHTISASMDP